jgi:hypothetical protein
MQNLFFKPRNLNLVDVLQRIILKPSGFSYKDWNLSGSEIHPIFFWIGEYLGL